MLSEAEYKRLMAAVQHEVRDGAILELLLQTGIRQSECAAIALDDIQLPARVSRDEGNVGLLRVHGKGHKDRIVTLNYKACRALKAYLAVRPKIDDEDALFLTKFEKPLGTRSIRNIVSKYLTEAGILAPPPMPCATPSPPIMFGEARSSTSCARRWDMNPWPPRVCMSAWRVRSWTRSCNATRCSRCATPKHPSVCRLCSAPRVQPAVPPETPSLKCTVNMPFSR